MELTTRPVPTPDEIVGMIAESAKAKGNDFLVKITRRRGGGPPVSVAQLGNARLEHFIVGASSHEIWVPKLLGGGLFSITVHNVNDPQGAGPVSPPLMLQVDGAPRDPDPNIFDQPDWEGPRECIFPPRAKASDTTHTTVPPGAGSGTGAANPASGPGIGGTSTAATDELSRQWANVTKAKEEALEIQRKAEIAAARRDAEAQIAAARREAELAVSAAKREAEIERRARDDQFQRLERSLEELRAKAAAPAPVLAPAAPVEDKFGQMMMEMRRADREAALEMAKIQAQAAAAQATAQAAQSAQAAELNKTLMAAVLAKPSSSDTAEKVFTSMAAAVSQMMGNQIQMFSAMNDLGMGPNQGAPEPEPEPAWARAAERIVKAFGSVVAQGNIRKAGQQPNGANGAQRQIPGRQPTGGAAQQPKPPAQPAPIPTGQPTQAAPAQAPAVTPSEVLPPESTQAAEDDGLISDPAVPQMIFDEIRAKAKPAAEIAGLIIKNIRCRELQDTLASDDDLRVILEKNIGMDWLATESNRLFARSVAAEFIEQGIQINMFPAAMAGQIGEMLDGLGEPEAT